MKGIILVLGLLTFSLNAFGQCKVQWVDHDYNLSTPAIQKQICDSSLDLPALPSPSLRPLQSPQIKPLETYGIPPLGTNSCRNQSVYENGRWVTKRLCN